MKKSEKRGKKAKKWLFCEVFGAKNRLVSWETMAHFGLLFGGLKMTTFSPFFTFFHRFSPFFTDFRLFGGFREVPRDLQICPKSGIFPRKVAFSAPKWRARTSPGPHFWRAKIASAETIFQNRGA